MAFSYTANGGIGPEGFQFNSLTGNGTTINLGTSRIGRVRICQDPLNTRVFSDWGTDVLQDNGTVVDGLDINLKLRLIDQIPDPDQDIFHFDLDCVVNQTTESMMITPTITMQPLYQPYFSVHYVSVELRIPPPGGDASTCRVLFPTMSGLVLPWGTDEIWEGGSRNFANPAVSWKGGNAADSELNPDTDTGLIKYDEPSDALASHISAPHQIWYLWDESSGDGLLIRTNDTVGQGKIYGVERDPSTDEIIFHIRFAPQDNSIGANGLSNAAFDYGVELRPMNGTWEDAIAYDATRKEAESHPAFSKPRIRKNPDYPNKARRMVCFASNWSTGTSQDFSKFTENLRRIKAYFGGEDWSTGGIWYGTGPGDLGETAPDYGPITAGAQTEMLVAADEKLSAIVYTIPIRPNKAALQAIEPALGIESDLVLTRQNYVMSAEPGVDASLKPLESEHPSIPASEGGTVYIAFDFTDSTNIEEYAAYILDQFVGVQIAGVYLDRYGIDGVPSNDNPALAANSRGFGSKTFTQGQYELSDAMRANLEDREGIIIHEWPNEFGIKHADIVTWGSVGANGVDTSQVNLPAIQYGDRVKHSTFGGYGRGPHPDLGFDYPGIVSRLEWHNAVYLYWHMCGHMMPVQTYWFLRDEYFLLEEGETGYEEWFVDAAAHYQFIKRLWWNQPELSHRFATSKRLYESPDNSIIKRKIDEKCGQVFATPLYLYTQSTYDPDADEVIIRGVNWTLSAEDGGYASQTVTWNETFTTTSHPQLGASARDVWLIDSETGIREALTGYDGGGSYQVPSVSMTPGRAVWLILGTDSTDVDQLQGEIRSPAALQGEWDLPKQNQDFTIYSGEDTTIEFVISEDGTALADHNVITEATLKCNSGATSVLDLSISGGEITVSTDKLTAEIQGEYTDGFNYSVQLNYQLWGIRSGLDKPLADGTITIKKRTL